MESFSGSPGWDALALTLLSSLPQQHSSWQQGSIYATAFQLQASVAASSKHRASISGFIIIPSSDGICSSAIQEIQREPACLHVLVDEMCKFRWKCTDSITLFLSPVDTGSVASSNFCDKIGQMKEGLILKSSKQEVWNLLINKLIVNNTIQYS